ncbi:MAG: DUF1934 domain-containing protein [Eubacteriales bacterium]
MTTKDVIVSVKGIQKDFVENDSVEVITTGQLYKKNSKYYINYVDSDLFIKSETKTTIKIAKDKIDIIRFGGSNTHMIFETNKKHMTHYDTPFGALLIGVITKNISFKEKDNSLELKVNYQLEINNGFVGENSFEVKVQEKSSNIHLMDRHFNHQISREEQL